MIGNDFKKRAAPYFSGDKPSFATTLLAALMKVYGVDVLEWDGITIQLQVKEDFGVDMPRKTYDKLMALILALSTDRVYKEVEVFDEVVNALNNRGFGTERDVPPVDHVAWAVAEIGLNDPEPVSRNPEDPWSKDIKKYARVVLDDEGMSRAPKSMDFAPERAPKAEGFDDPAFFAAAWGSADERAAEIDALIEKKAGVLIEQLLDLGIDFSAAE